MRKPATAWNSSPVRPEYLRAVAKPSYSLAAPHPAFEAAGRRIDSCQARHRTRRSQGLILEMVVDGRTLAMGSTEAAQF